MVPPNINMFFEICEKLSDEIPDPIWGSHSATLILLSSHLLHRNHYKKSTQGRAVNDTPELKACHLSIALGKFILLKISSCVSYDVIISSLTLGNWGFVSPPAIQQVTQIPMKCLVSPLSYFGATSLSLAWIKISYLTVNYEQGKLKYDSKTALPFAQVLPTARDGHRLRGLQDVGCTRQLCLQQTEPTADSLPPSQLPRQHLSLGANGGVGGCLRCCWRLSSAGRRAENWLTQQCRKEQDCLYGFHHRYLGYPLLRLLTDISG